ncbi:MAG: GTP cyclohydrolase II [Lautropia sp.]|nr:GTP cyclohydrolase II [Lautropia sp.]
MTASLAYPDRVSRRASILLDRALTELRHGRAVIIQTSSGSPWLFAAVETLTQPAWQQLQDIHPVWRLFLSAQRVRALGLAGAGSQAEGGGVGVSEDGPGVERPWTQRLPAGIGLNQLWQAAGLDVSVPVSAPEPLLSAGLVPLLQPGRFEGAREASGAPASADGLTATTAEAGQHAPEGEGAFEAVSAVLVLARQGRLAPAVVGIPCPAGADAGLADWLDDVLRVPAEPILAQARLRPVWLERVSEAPVPLADAEDSHFVMFREPGSDFEHVAVVVGKPAADLPVRVRLHSSCITGDLFGSLRCDCGDQLRGTVKRLAQGGGGIVLYLSQEGRGIGLANKLRAYRRQDQGLDTLDANQSLGFRVDERHFEVAAGMLLQLGVKRIHLLTNNPAKIAALSAAGIEVVEREEVMGGVNPHNQRYLATKLKRGGHLFDEDSLQNP